MRIADLPFHEQPVLELLDLATDRDEVNHDYAGYGWARVPRLWLVDADQRERAVDNALLLALHTADDAPALVDDLELELDLPDGPIAVHASKFLAVWLPRLPRDGDAVVLAVCNPHAARVAFPAEAASPLHVPTGDVTAWRDRETGAIKLVAEAWTEVMR